MEAVGEEQAEMFDQNLQYQPLEAAPNITAHSFRQYSHYLCVIVITIILTVYHFHNKPPIVLSNQPQIIRKNIQTEEKDELQVDEKRVAAQNFDDLNNHPLYKQHLHSISPSQYPTLGVPTTGAYFNYTKVCPQEFKAYELMLNSLFKPYNDTDCEHGILGTKNDESYILCKNFISHSQALLNLGLQGKDSFGCSISSQYNIPNYLFECVKSYEEGTCNESSSHTFFAKKCFGQRAEVIEGYTFTTIHGQIDRLQLKDKAIVVKMDIEGAQWQALRSLPIGYLDNIDQLVLQVHLPQKSEEMPYWGNVDIINSLKQKFISVNMHMNNFARIPIQEMRRQDRLFICHAFQITLVNKRLIKVHANTRSYSEKVKNLDNNPDREHIEMFE